MTDVFIAEFEKLKDEQISRAAHRDRLFHLTIILIGGGFTLALSEHENAYLVLLFLPVVAFIAGVSHLGCDRRISAIGSYFKDALAPKIAKSLGVRTEEVLSWEVYIRADRHRHVRKWLQLATNLLLYVGSGVCALVWYGWFVIQHRHAQPGLAGFIGVPLGIVLMVIMLGQFVSHAYIGSPSDKPEARIGRLVRSGLGVLVTTALVSAAYWFAIRFGGQFIPGPDSIVVVPGLGETWHVTRLNAAAVTSALIAGGIGLLCFRR